MAVGCRSASVCAGAEAAAAATTTTAAAAAAGAGPQRFAAIRSRKPLFDGYQLP